MNATQNWLDRTEVHRDGQVCTGGSLLPSLQRGIWEISTTVVSHIEQIGQECADSTSIRLSSCSHNQEPSPSRIRRRSCTTHSPEPYRRWHPSSSSDSWWNWDTSRSWWSSWVQFIFENVCCSRFRLQLIAIYCNWRCVYTVHLSRHFFSCTAHMFNNVLHNTLAQVSARARHLIYMVIHVVWLSVLWLSVPHLVPFRVFLLSLLLLPGHWPVPLPPCGRYQGN